MFHLASFITLASHKSSFRAMMHRIMRKIGLLDFPWKKTGSLLVFLVYFFSLVGTQATTVRAATVITFSGSEHLGNPTDTSITINIVPNANINVFYEYGTASGVYTGQTSTELATAGEPYEVVINGLQPNTRYYYRMQYQVPGETDWVLRNEYTFHTHRPQGSTFQFVLTSDSHVNVANLGNANEWKQALDRIAVDDPDFLIDLGDTFQMDNVSTAAVADANYLYQRSPDFMGRVSHSSPIFLAIGNHENEEGWNFDDTNPQPIFSMNARKRYFPLPQPGSFYSGNTDNSETRIVGSTPNDHLREDYYAWEWGDALFIVFDPFQYTMQNPYGATAGEGNDEVVGGDRWNWTLGTQQYNWLKSTLENSDAKYKFMFAHHMLGGTQNYVRGGAEAAGWFEWGGNTVNASNQNPVWQFDAKRPGWAAPIHQLMMDNGVTAFFHGHDHQFVYEKRDGIVYQLVPSPSQGTSNGFNSYVNSPYVQSGGILSNSGYLRVTVSPSAVLVEYVSTSTGAVRYSYTIDSGSATPTNTPTATRTSTPTNTPTRTPTSTVTSTPTLTATRTPTPTSTPTTANINTLVPTVIPGAMRFAAVGDFGVAGQPELDVANLIKSWDPEFIITLGDNNYNTGSASTIDLNIGQYYHDFIYPYTGSYGAGAPGTNLFFPALGNHDWDTTNAQPYLDYFTLPGNERYYDFVKGPVHFFVVDSDSREPDGITSTSTQAIWLQNQLASSTSTWNVVYMHHPPYSSGGHGSTTALQWNYAAWGADVVLAGHEHDYERISRNGIPYIINGLGGASISGFGTTVSGSQLRYNADYGAMVIEAGESQINFRFITRTGALIDSYTLNNLPTATPTNTATRTPTNTVTRTPTDTSTTTPTGTRTSTSTPTPTYTMTGTPTNTVTHTLTSTLTATYTPTRTATTTPTFTPTATFTTTNTLTYTPTYTHTVTPTVTTTPTHTATKTYTFTPTYTFTSTPTNTPVATGTTANVNVLIGGDPKGSYEIVNSDYKLLSYPSTGGGPLFVQNANANPLVSSIQLLYKNNKTETLSELMGVPTSQLSNDYWMPVYIDDATHDSQIRFINTHATLSTTVNVYVGNNPTPVYTRLLGPQEADRVRLTGVTGGPLHIKSTTAGVNILAGMRIIYKGNKGNSSFDEIMALPPAQLDDEYWFPFYNHNNANLFSELHVGNPTNTDTTVDVFIGNTLMEDNRPLPAYSYFLKSYPGTSGGPLRIVSNDGTNIIASMRLLYKNSKTETLSELMGVPTSQLSNDYWMPVYIDDLTHDSQIRFTNTHNSLSTTVNVYLGDNPTPVYTKLLGPQEADRVRLTGVTDGPIHIESTTVGVNILAGMRIIYKSNFSFDEIMALPTAMLDDEYWFPFYNHNNVNLFSEVLIGVP